MGCARFFFGLAYICPVWINSFSSLSLEHRSNMTWHTSSVAKPAMHCSSTNASSGESSCIVTHRLIGSSPWSGSWVTVDAIVFVTSMVTYPHPSLRRIAPALGGSTTVFLQYCHLNGGMNRVSGCGVMNRPTLTCDEGKAERKGQESTQTESSRCSNRTSVITTALVETTQ